MIQQLLFDSKIQMLFSDQELLFGETAGVWTVATYPEKGRGAGALDKQRLRRYTGPDFYP